jgi:hypothetical protein
MPRFSQPATLLFVDPTVGDLPILPAQIAPKAEMLGLAADQDGVEQITAALSNRHGLHSLHIVSPSHSGRLQLGTAHLTLFNLERYGWELQQWGESLMAGAEIVFHEGAVHGSDNLASPFSEAFLSRLHLLTGTKIILVEAQQPQQSVGF